MRAVRVLRLANSDDVVGDVPPALRSAAISERVLAEAVGEPVETVRRTVWPSDDLPDLVERWIGRYEPDLVSLTVASFWVAFASVPLRLQRRLPVIGPPLASFAFRAAGNERLAHNAAFRAVRRTMLRCIGGDYHFEPEYVVPLMEECFRRVLRSEDVGLAVRGPRAPLDRRQPARAARRGAAAARAARRAPAKCVSGSISPTQVGMRG